MRWSTLLGGLLLSLLACNGDGGDSAADGASPCGRDSDCDDGVFCNGVERCDPTSASASALGCVPGEAPCECDVANDRCIDGCPDMDGDGANDVACGGDDCDDTDPLRYPGAPEVCDEGGRDEDCDPTTLGPDGDGDGFAPTVCCNGTGAERVCGSDCDDTRDGVSPLAVDGCGGGDEDCDGNIDEAGTSGDRTTCWDDPDRDGYATIDAREYSVCDVCPSGTTPTAPVGADIDCNGTRIDTYPGAMELCDRVDNDCDGTDGSLEDADGDGFVPVGFTGCEAGFLEPGDCRDDNPDVFPGQVLFFDTPYCPNGGTPEMVTQTRCGFWLCPGTAGAYGGETSFDYDCTGTDDPEHENRLVPIDCSTASFPNGYEYTFLGGSSCAEVGVSECNYYATFWECAASSGAPYTTDMIVPRCH